MDSTTIVAIFVVIDDMMTTLSHPTHPLAGASDSEVLTVVTVTDYYFQNHHKRAVCVLCGMGYLSRTLSVSRFNRRLHVLAQWFTWTLDLLCELFALRATAFTLDSLPVPVRTWVRAHRNKKVSGHMY